MIFGRSRWEPWMLHTDSYPEPWFLFALGSIVATLIIVFL